MRQIATKPDAASKALKLAARYAVLHRRICDCKRRASHLYSSCENPTFDGDVKTGSGCLSTLSDLIRDNRDKPFGIDLSFEELVEEAEFCRPCSVGLSLRRHVKKTLSKRRASVLAAICRLGKMQKRSES